MQERMAVGFVDLEKAYDTVPREMVMATVRRMGVPEAEARMVEVMYERTKGRVVLGSGLSEEFPVNINLRQGSALSPFPASTPTAARQRAEGGKLIGPTSASACGPM